MFFQTCMTLMHKHQKMPEMSSIWNCALDYDAIWYFYLHLELQKTSAFKNHLWFHKIKDQCSTQEKSYWFDNMNTVNEDRTI